MFKMLAPAKINLHLHITGITPQGYHLLDTSFAYVDVCDVLHIEKAEDVRVTCSDASLDGENNLVFRVLHTLRENHQVAQGIHVHVEKNLPSQAGLGGGSSDAATALMVANHLWGLNLTSRELSTFATPFGADIPCFLFGAASIGHGIGDKLEPLELSEAPQHVVLAHPGVGLSTAEVFAHFDSTHAAHPGQLTPAQLTLTRAKATMRAGLTAGAAQALPLGENMLEDVSLKMCPELALLLAEMRQAEPASWMSGSGTACISLCGSAGQAEKLAGHLVANKFATWTHAGTLLASHPLFNSSMQPADWGVAKR